MAMQAYLSKRTLFAGEMVGDSIQPTVQKSVWTCTKNPEKSQSVRLAPTNDKRGA